MVGGQDELVFDGGSIVVDADGEVQFRAPLFEEGLYPVELDASGGRLHRAPPCRRRCRRSRSASTRRSCSALRDYVEHNGFPGVVLGLSGGVDSALDARDRGRRARRRARARGDDAVALHVGDERRGRGGAGARARRALRRAVDRADVRGHAEALATCSPACPPDTTEENIQARCRGVLLMAISNKIGQMVLTTGNKSEMAVGYATLYGDMAGGFAPLKDCTRRWSTGWRAIATRIATVIPERVITRAPSAELRDEPEGQRLAAAVRRARPDPRGVHREGALGRPDRGARLRPRDGGARAADGEARRVQAPSGAAGRARQQPGVRPRLALSDHLRILRLAQSAPARDDVGSRRG